MKYFLRQTELNDDGIRSVCYRELNDDERPMELVLFWSKNSLLDR